MLDEHSLGALPRLLSAISSLEPTEYAALVGALSIFPANSHKIPSLGGLAHLAACGVPAGSARISPQAIRTIVQLTAQWSGGADDPAETTNSTTIATGWGDYCVFTSDPHTAFRLSRLIDAVVSGGLPPELQRVAMAALAVSTAIAKRTTFDSSDSFTKNVYVPPSAQLRKAMGAVVFTDEDLAAITADVGCTPDDLTSLTLSYGTRPVAQFPQMGDPLQEHAPIIRIGANTIVYAPRFLGVAAVNAIVAKCPLGARHALSLAYHEQVLNCVRRCLHVLGYQELWRDKVAEVDSDAILTSVRWRSDQLRQLTTIILTEFLSACPDLGSDWRISQPLPAPRVLRPIEGCGVGAMLHIFVFAQLARHPHAEIRPAPGARLLTIRADELEAMCQAHLALGREADSSLELWRYYEATHSKDYTGFALCLLDQYAMWRAREKRIVQGLEEPPHWLSIQPGFGIEVRKDAAKAAATAKRFRQRSIVLPMVPRDGPLRLYVPYFPPPGFIWYLESEVAAIWFTADDNENEHFIQLTRAVAFWLGRLPEYIRTGFADSRSHAVQIEWQQREVKSPFSVSSFSDRRIVVVSVSKAFWSQIIPGSNQAEMALVTEVLRKVLFILDRVDLHSGLMVFETEMLQTPLRRTLHAVHSDDHPGLLFRAQLPPPRPISLHDRTVVRRTAAAAMKAGGTPIHAAVGAVFTELENDVRVYDAAASLRTLMEHVEGFAADQGFRTATDVSLRAFGDITKSDATDRRINEQALRAQAVRYLVELVAVTDGTGKRCLPDSTLDRWTAAASELINLGTLGDIQYFRLSDDTPKVGKLDYVESLGSYGRAGAAVERALAREFKLVSNHVESRMDEERTRELDAALGKELGITFEQLFRFNRFSIDTARELGRPILRFLENEFFDAVATNLSWTEETARRFLESFAIRPRSPYNAIPGTWNKSDVHPWRLNREGSYIRRPVIWGTAGSVWFSPGHVARSADYILRLCLDGRMKARTKELKTIMGEITQECNEHFNDLVGERLIECGYKTHVRVNKFGKAKLVGQEGDLGDIDVLAVDHSRRKIWALECKDFLLGRSPHEVVNDLNELFRTDSGKRRTVQQKILARTAWLRSHVADVIAHLGLRGRGWKIVDAIIFSRPLLSPLLGQAQIPVMTLFELRGRGCLENARTPK